MTCSGCVKSTPSAFVCDEDVEKKLLCIDCFVMTPCGKNEHSPRCATGRFDVPAKKTVEKPA